MKNIAVMISGSGTNLQSIIDWKKEGKLQANISIVISNNENAFGIKRAEKAGIKTKILKHRDFSTREEHEFEIEKQLKDNNVELIVLAGYMRLLTSDFVKRWPLKIINLHPSLLPSFPGINAIEKAFNYGAKITGVSTIFVDEGVDTGIIIMQDVVEILCTDNLVSLTEKIHDLEHNLLPQSINLVIENNYSIQGRRVIIQPKDSVI
jgi:phosphoribosylglycinamide formyltransferase-1